MPEIPPLPRRGLRCGFFPGARGTWSLPSFRYDWLEEGSMPVPFMQPMTPVVDCIHNATKTKNQDEISFPGGKPDPSVEKFHGASGTRGAPRQPGGEFPPPAPLPPPLAGSEGGTGYARRVRLLWERRKGPRVVRGKDGCFILGEAVGPR